MEPITLMLPYPPSGNHLKLIGRNGRMVKTQEAKDYQERVGWIVRKACYKPRTERLCLTITVYPPRGIGQDLDNVCKNLFDALMGAAYVDDSQIWHFSIERRHSVKGGRISLVIENYDTEEPTG